MARMLTRPEIPLPTYDITARKAHQWAIVGLVASALVAGGVPAALLLTVAGIIMVVGRFWWPADVFRQLVWRVLEPAGILRRHEAHEDRETRRLARVMAGILWIACAALLLAHLPILTWALAFAMAIMVGLDASVDFCTLCFLFHQLEQRGLLPGAFRHRPATKVAGEA